MKHPILRQLAFLSLSTALVGIADDHRVQSLRAQSERVAGARAIAPLAPAGGSAGDAGGGGGGSGSGSPTGSGQNPTRSGQTPSNGNSGQTPQGNNSIQQALEKAQNNMNDGLKKLQDAANQVGNDNSLQELANAAKAIGGVASGGATAIASIADQMIESLGNIGESRKQLATIATAQFAANINTEYQNQKAPNVQQVVANNSVRSGTPVATAMGQKPATGDPLANLTQLPKSIGLVGEQTSRSNAYNPPVLRR